jgi:hypothetical protein
LPNESNLRNIFTARKERYLALVKHNKDEQPNDSAYESTSSENPGVMNASSISDYRNLTITKSLTLLRRMIASRQARICEVVGRDTGLVLITVTMTTTTTTTTGGGKPQKQQQEVKEVKTDLACAETHEDRTNPSKRDSTVGSNHDGAIVSELNP